MKKNKTNQKEQNYLKHPTSLLLWNCSFIQSNKKKKKKKKLSKKKPHKKQQKLLQNCYSHKQG